MKKNLFLWLMLIMLGFGGMAQTEVTIGNGSYSSNNVAPVHLYFKYSISQSIYLAEEIGTVGSITSIAYKQTVEGGTRTISVYMAETDKSQFSSSSDALSADEFTQVFSGSWTIGVGEWSAITLDTPFDYTGEGNLVVAVVDQTGSYVGGSKYFQSSTGTGRTLYQNSDYTQYSLSNTYYSSGNYYPDIKLTIEADGNVCHAVSNLAASGVTATSATVSWTAPEDGGSYIVMYKKSNQSWEDDDVVTIDGISETEYEITGLSAATTYNVRVINDCGDNQSAARSTNFTTLCTQIADLPYVQNFDAVATDSMPACWAKLNPYTNYPRVTTSKAMSGKAMEFHANGASYAVLPEFEEDLSNLQISFYTRREGANSGSFDAGYIFNMDTATFVPVYSTTSGEIGDNDYHKIIAKFTEFESDGESVANIAFRYKNAPSFSNWYWFVDEVKVDYATDCAEPSQLSSSNITSTSADLSWVSDADDYTVYYKKTSDTEYEIYENVTLDDNNVYALEGLDPETKYTWYVEANCGSVVPSDTATFTTECSPHSELPYTWDFESDNTGGTTANPLPSCWKRNEANSTTYPYVFETTSTSLNVTSGTHYLYFSTTGNTAIMNAIDIESFEITQLQILFNGRSSATAGSPIIVGVMTDPFNASTFDTVSVVTLSNVMDGYEVNFSNYEGEGTYIALRNGTYNSVYVDDLVLDYISDCPRVQNLTVSGITSEGATVTWTGSVDNYVVRYRAASDSVWNTEDAEIDGKTATLSGLNPTTAYVVQVAPDCGDEIAETMYKSVNFTTICGIYELPFETSIENSAEDQCWTVASEGEITEVEDYDWEYYEYTYTYPEFQHSSYYSSNARTGIGYIALGAEQGSTLVLAAPKVNANIEDLRLQFYARNAYSYSFYEVGTLQVGVMSNPADTSTFVLVENIELAGSTYELVKVDFNEAGVTGSDYNIAFRLIGAGIEGESNLVYVDDITINNIPTCLEPSGVAASNITTTSADITWTSDEESFNLYYKKASDSEYEVMEGVSLTDGIYTLESLSPSQSYILYVATVCPDGSESNSSTISFNTACAAITEIPTTWTFEAPNAGGTSSYPLPACWTRPGTGNYPYCSNNSTSAHNGNYYLYFAGSSNSMAVLPAIDPAAITTANTQISLFARGNNNKLQVGYLTDPTNASTFTELTTLTLTSSYEQYSVALPEYDGEGYLYIGLRTPNSEYVYVDDVTLEEIPECSKALNLASENVTITTADLSWSANGDNLNVYYKASGAEEYDVQEGVYLSEGIYTLENLEPATTYLWYVETVCDDTTYKSAEKMFTTLCDVISEFPYTESFENGFGCWTTNIISSTADWTVESTLYQSNTTPDGSKYALFKTSLHGPVAELISPVFDLTSLSNAYLSFYHIQKLWTNDQDELYIYYKTSPTAEKMLLTSFTSDISTWQMDSIALPFPSEEYQIIFEGHSDYGWGIGLDKIMVYDGTGAGPILCATPINLQVSDITATSATITWTGNAESYNITYGDVELTSDENSITLEDLTPSTNYTVTIVGDCGDDGLSNPATVSFTSGCAAITSVPRTWDFEAPNTGGTTANPLPACWTRLNTYYPYCYSYYPHSGSYSLYFYNSDHTAVLPQVDTEVLPLNTLQVSFYARTYSSTNIPLIVGVMSDPANASTFETIATINVGSSHELYDVDFSAYEGTGAYIAFKSGSTTSIYVDDVTLDFAPDCPKPTDVTVSAVSSNSATISWSGSNENGYTVKYRKSGTETWNEETVIAESIDLTGLDDATNYEVEITPVCEGSSTSATISFTTLCSIIAEFPYTESFENGLGCWTTEVINIATWEPSNLFASDGSYSMRFPYTQGAIGTITSPVFDFSGLTSPTLKYDMYIKVFSSTKYDTVGVYYRTSASSEWVHIYTHEDNGDASTFGTFVFTLPEVTNSYQVMFKGYGLDAWAIYLDNVVVFDSIGGDIPVVVEPTVATNNAQSVTQTTAVLNGEITNPGNQTITARGFEWKAAAGGTVATVNATGTTTFSANLTGLTAGTEYTFRAYATTAGGNSYGEWKNFTTSTEPVEPCNMPTNVTVADFDKQSITLTWDANGAEKWAVQYRKQGATAWTLGSNNITAATYTIGGLEEATVYEYQVQAICDGTTSEWTQVASQTTGIDSRLLESIKLYPNPASDYVEVRVSDNDVKVSRLEVYDVYGKLLNEVEVIDNPTRINVSSLSNGMYYVRVITENGVATKNFIKR